MRPQHSEIHRTVVKTCAALSLIVVPFTKYVTSQPDSADSNAT